MIVVDTSVWIGLFRRHDLPAVQALKILPTADILVGDVVLLEVLQGMSTEEGANRKFADLRSFTMARMLGTDAAIQAARNYRYLRAQGVTVRSTADCIIATYCLRKGYQLLHNDRDFDAFEKHLGLNVLH
jgi:predicted nucleic acid-binding protein